MKTLVTSFFILLLSNFALATTSADCAHTKFPFSCSYLRAFERAQPLDLDALPKRPLCWSRFGGGSATNVRYNSQNRPMYKEIRSDRARNNTGVEHQHAVFYMDLSKTEPTAYGFAFDFNFDGFSGLTEGRSRRNAAHEAIKFSKKVATPLRRLSGDWVSDRYDKQVRLIARVTYRQLDGFLIAAYDINPTLDGSKFDPDLFLEVPMDSYKIDCLD